MKERGSFRVLVVSWEQKVKRVNEDYVDILVKLVSQANRDLAEKEEEMVNQALKAFQGLAVIVGTEVWMGCQGDQAQKVTLVPLGYQVKQENEAQKGKRVTKEYRDPRECLGRKDLQENQDSLDLQDQGDQLEHLVKWGLLVHGDQRDHQGLLDQLDHPDFMGQGDQQDRLAHQVFQDQRENVDFLDQSEFVAVTGHQDFQDPRVHREKKEMLDVLACREYKVIQVERDRRGHVDLLDYKGRKVTQVSMEQMDQRVKKGLKATEGLEGPTVRRDQLEGKDPKVVLVGLGAKAYQAPLEPRVLQVLVE